MTTNICESKLFVPLSRNDHKMSEYCSFLIFWLHPPCCWPNFLYNFGQTFSCEDQFIMNIVCIRIVVPHRPLKLKTRNKRSMHNMHIIDYTVNSTTPSIKSPVKAICHYWLGICYWFPFLSHSVPVILLSVSYLRSLQK